jgi:hypothetical protein
LSAVSSAKSEKYAAGPSFSTCVMGGVAMSQSGLILPAGGWYGLFHWLSVVVDLAVGLCAPDDPADRRGAMNEGSFRRKLALPAWPGNRQHLRAGSGGALTRAVEHVSPHVAHLQQIEAPPESATLISSGSCDTSNHISE